ncbi:MAG: thioredoxin domain-containing protein [Aquificaceae bacterium]|nr:thioredoxin domain-containing protein [Aquificaceae bacterium]
MANRLINSKSPYLRKSAYQPVDWYEWSEDAFRRAREEDKPLLLSVGGVWCHWCHVMAHESFEDKEIAEIINSNFVPVKVDRDERPDIDRRYQEVVMAITGSGGWPLTVFLTPEGKAFFGGTYFPPHDRWGRPGFKSILLRIAQLWKEERHKILKSADSIYESVLSYNLQNFKDPVREDFIEKGISSLLINLDYEHGGIGTAPKFHHAKAFELLIYHNFFHPSETLNRAITLSLDAMAKGGIFDHLLGGFFRYSTDERWHVPHFEKMLYDNAELLSLYSLAYQIFGKSLYRKTAKGIWTYYRQKGCDQRGGFYASQDADIGLLDEGGHYTFTQKEIEDLLTPEELKLASMHFGYASMPHEPHKKVLYINMEEEDVSKRAGMPLEEVSTLLERVKTKLREHREKRETPYVDKTLYTNWNALMVSALCDYWKVFGEPEAKNMAERTIDRILDEYYMDGVLYHKEGVKGFSEDYLFLAQALLKILEVTQERRYLELSYELAKKAIELFWDEKDWGFYDTAEGGEGLLQIRMKNLQDTPTQSVNGSAGYTLLLLGTLTEDASMIDYAEKTLQSFSRLVKDAPMVSFSYFISLYAYLKGIYKVETRDFFEESLNFFRPFKFVLRSEVEGLLVCEGQTCKRYDNLNQILT